MRLDRFKKVAKPERRRFRCPCRLPNHSCAYWQIGTTFVGLATCVVALICSLALQQHMERLSANFTGELSNEDLPCARKPLPVCDSKAIDRCADDCCPNGYMCIRDPTVGLYCQNRDWSCGRYDFCIGIADMPGTCEKLRCQERNMVEKMAAIVFIMVAIAAFLDLFDVFFCLALPDNVFVKSIGNLLSFLVKLLAFACMLGVGTGGYLTDLLTASCYNDLGYTTGVQALQVFRGGVAALFFSFCASFGLAPISALKGGRVRDEPNYRLKALEIGA
mmetsp:Transcript_88810/g.248572  ORF Transcript_88810/g.248572 Transcript_88810/m.248572 type:complete len:276 (-) Transcript_88810:117-944(-)|eukprot:CAMPEP_0176214880 /NCGR_PEP_ID=MMETSP0121_2-20121125/16397_1 /TAXON_ID=160619 /ORGANISM="Kryptoperidinium foliaceum, Strain CCMP 1326" /LENGTH=275 /DNA_ID=CAMNT_0017553977 /DNA_START=107 /DNA_END=934 /DNA_ORIENTATION=-